MSLSILCCLALSFCMSSPGLLRGPRSYGRFTSPTPSMSPRGIVIKPTLLSRPNNVSLSQTPSSTSSPPLKRPYPPSPLRASVSRRYDSKHQQNPTCLHRWCRLVVFFIKADLLSDSDSTAVVRKDCVASRSF